MADELDLQSQITESASRRDSGHNQNADMRPTADPDVEANLDDLLKAETGEPVPVDPDLTVDPPKPKEDDDDDKDKKTVVPDPESDTGDDDAAPSDSDSDDSDGESVDDDEDKDDDADNSDAKDELDKIELPPHTSEKAADSFNAIKEKAREQIEAKNAELKELQVKVAEFENKETVTPEEKSELEDLRRFRAAAEIEKDPAIVAEFTTKIEGNDAVIYKALADAGMTEKQIKDVKDMGGPNKLSNWDAIYEHLSASQKRSVDARLTENENLSRDRDLKIEAAKKDVDKYLEANSKTSKAGLERDAKVIETQANDMLKQMAWVDQQEIPKDATDDQKKAIESANKFAGESFKTLEGLLTDRSAETHATLAIGTVQALYFRQQLDVAADELKTLRKDNKTLTTRLNKIKKSGSPVRSGGAPPKGLKPKGDNFTTTAEDSIDAIRREVEGT